MKRYSAFTLIETIIAISVFCVGILTVLFWVSKTLRNQDYANVQIKSAFFAREWIELLFNIRDANYRKELPWNCVYTWTSSIYPGWCYKNFSTWTFLKVSIASWDSYVNVEIKDKLPEDFTWIFNEYQIYLHTWFTLGWNTWFIYNHNPDNWKETWFARYLVITGVVDENSDLLDTDKLLKIESHVLYKRAELTWEKVMETFIWNHEF